MLQLNNFIPVFIVCVFLLLNNMPTNQIIIIVIISTPCNQPLACTYITIYYMCLSRTCDTHTHMHADNKINSDENLFCCFAPLPFAKFRSVHFFSRLMFKCPVNPQSANTIGTRVEIEN